MKRGQVRFLGWFVLIAAAVIAWVAGCQPVPAATKVIHKDLGGVIAWYIQSYQWNAALRTKYVIAGDCASACTLILGIIPRERVCVRPAARLGFHSAWTYGGGFQPTDQPAGTRLMWSWIPRDVQADLWNTYGWQGWKGNTAHLDFMWLPASRYYRICGQ